MARQLSDLTVQLSGTPLAFRWPGNEAFLKGTSRRPQTFSWNVGESLIYIYNLSFFGYVTLTMIVHIAFIAIWHSPLAVETTAMIDGYQDGTVSYHYFTGSTRHDKIEPASRFEPAWDSVEPTNPVVYLTFDQSMSRLDLNVRKLNLGVALILAFCSLYVFVVWKIMKDYWRKMVLHGNARHLLEGRIFTVRNTWKSPLIIYSYIFLSPTTGAEISGRFSIDRDSPRNRDFQQGTLVAILYRDDKLHIVL